MAATEKEQEMRTFPGRYWFWLACIVAISAHAVYSQPPSPARTAPLKVGQVPVANILQRLGAKLESGSTPDELDSYSSHFDRMDLDKDGRHTKAEYIDKGSYMTPQARAGIFRAADGNADGIVTKAEYVLNRVITDEAKTKNQKMDDDKESLVERTEFVKHATRLLYDIELAEQTLMAGFPSPSTCEFGDSGRVPDESRPSSASRRDGRPRGKSNRLLRTALPVQWD